MLMLQKLGLNQDVEDIKEAEKQIVIEFLTRLYLTRFKALTQILKKYKVPYSVEKSKGCKNVVVSFSKCKSHRLLVAHYDVFMGSTGINDNTCAVAMLINLAIRLIKAGKSPNIKLLFADLEESGMHGSRHYSKAHKSEIEHAIVFDIIGYGDTHVYHVNGQTNLDFIEERLDALFVTTHLVSDNFQFEFAGIPCALLTAAHSKDIFTYSMPTIDGSNKRRDYVRLRVNAEFYKSFHNRELDNLLGIINFKLIQSLGNKLFELYSKEKDFKV